LQPPNPSAAMPIGSGLSTSLYVLLGFVGGYLLTLGGQSGSLFKFANQVAVQSPALQTPTVEAPPTALRVEAKTEGNGWNPRPTYSDWHKPSAMPGSPLVQFGDCRPFCDREKLKALLPEFLEVYKKRPFKINTCGQNVMHAFITYALARLLKPEVIIENGVNAGGGSYILRSGAPHARAYHIDPLDKPICDKRMKRWMNETNAKYLTGEKFVDFQKYDWDKEGIPKDKALVLFDTHVNDWRDTIEAAKKGFRWVYVDDNYPGHEPGDMKGMALKQVLSKQNDDSFQLWNHLEMYYEVPPLILLAEYMHNQEEWKKQFPKPQVFLPKQEIVRSNFVDPLDPMHAFTEPLLNMKNPTDKKLV